MAGEASGARRLSNDRIRQQADCNCTRLCVEAASINDHMVGLLRVTFERKAAAGVERSHSARILFSLTSEFGDNSSLRW
jgi:hypothetical protein